MDFVETASLLIRLGIGFNMVVFGLSQLRSPQKWLPYMPKIIQFLMPIKPTSFMRIHSFGNIILGLLLMIGLWQPVSIWLALLWWASILPFAFLYEFGVGIRDLSIVMCLIALLVLQS
jgi:hypothetical protein